MADVLILGLVLFFTVSAYLWRVSVGNAIFALFAGIWLDEQFSQAFVKWLGDHNVQADKGFLWAMTSAALIMVPPLLSYRGLKHHKGKFGMRIFGAITLGLLSGYYLSLALSKNATFAKTFALDGPVSATVKPVIFLITVAAMFLGVGDMYVNKTKKAKATLDEGGKK